MAIGARPGKAMLVTDEENLVTLPITAEKAKAFAEKYGIPKIYTDINDMLGGGNIFLERMNRTVIHYAGSTPIKKLLCFQF